MSVDLTNCDREPIHIIGRIQSFGYLLAVSSDWIVTFVSANLCTIAGIDATALIGGPAIALLSENGIHTLRTRLQLLTTETSVERILELDLFGQEQLFDVALHRSGRNIVIEAEPSDTSALAKFVSYVRPMTERIRQASSVQAMCDLAARQMRALTGFDRVMIYRFSGYGAGEVLSRYRQLFGHAFPRLGYSVASPRALYEEPAAPDRRYRRSHRADPARARSRRPAA
jgi:light-regulated signal transduction histidine kinase (bacteriophytochrome)